MIDYIDEVLTTTNPSSSGGVSKQADQNQICNFQVASCTLDASVKIWSNRVDSVHSDTFKVLSGLNRSTADEAKAKKKEGLEDEDDNDDDQSKSKSRTKKASLSLANTLENNLANINGKKLDMEFSVDPLFHKTSAAFDEVSCWFGN